MNIPNIEEINDKEVLINLRDYLLKEKEKQTPEIKIRIITPYSTKELKDKFTFIKPYAIDKKATVKQIQEQSEDNSWDVLYAIANKTGIEKTIKLPVQKEEKHQRVFTPIITRNKESIAA